MKKTSFNNLFFIFSIIIIFFSIAILNYHTDKYRMFNNKTPKMNNSDVFINGNLAYLYLDSYKDIKSENVVVGASDSELMFSNDLNDYFYHGLYINHKALSFKSYYRVLKRYLELHKETKNVIIVVSYAIFSTITREISDYEKDKNNLNRYFYLLFSLDVCKYSFNILKDRISSIFVKNGQQELNQQNEILSWYNPYNVPEYKFDKFIKQKNDEELIYFNKIINMLQEKNIQYYVLIPPYSSLLLKVLDSTPEFKDEILRIKRHITDKSGTVYDCAYINKYTKQKLFGEHYLYRYGSDHPNFIFGIKLFKVFFDKENANRDFYMILNNENIDEQLKIQENILAEYTKETKEEYDIYLNMPEVKQRLVPCWKRIEEYTIDDIPAEYRKEIEYMNNKIKLYNSEKEEEDGKNR